VAPNNGSTQARRPKERLWRVSVERSSIKE